MAQNPFNVVVPTLDYSHPQAPTTQSYHGVSIMVNNQIIGRVETWAVQGVYTRGAIHVRELNHRTFGRAVDIVPGVGQDYIAQADRFEVWNEEAEKALGFNRVFTDLLDQTYPFSVKEVWLRGRSPYRIMDYFGCWLTSKEIGQFQVNTDPIIRATVQIHFVSKQVTFGR